MPKGKSGKNASKIGKIHRLRIQRRRQKINGANHAPAAVPRWRP